MRLLSVEIHNYKSFENSERIAFERGFNLIVGQNNSGKTALLEALNPENLIPKPHRNPRASRGSPVDPRSHCIFEFELSGQELRNVLLKRRNDFNFPIPPNTLGDQVDRLETTLAAEKITFRLRKSSGLAWETLTSPSHQLFRLDPARDQTCSVFGVTPDMTNFILRGSTPISNDNVGIIAAEHFFGGSGLYTFRAERPNIGSSPFGRQELLAPDASNLPTVLITLMGNRVRFDRFNHHVQTIFPSIRQVVAIPAQPSGNLVEIRIWQVEPSTERDDLAVDLRDSGTGVGQVLAILYVITVADSPRTIVIDEPNSFLHPGAARKLIEILREHQEHQYIIATHSPETIRATDPCSLHLLRWENYQSNVVSVNPRQVTDVRQLLMEVGTRLSDVYGADFVLWVEGITEQECFPKIIAAFQVPVPSGTSIVSVRSTDEIASRRLSARAIWDIYRQISSPNTLLPRTVAIVLDREGRTSQFIDDLRRESNQLISFLPRRAYENYLIDADAIAAILNETQTFAGHPIAGERVVQWLNQFGATPRYFFPLAALAIGNERWKIDVNAPLLLADLFSELSEAREEYRKVKHSVRLTEWLLDHRKDRMSDFVDFLKSLFHE